ncbi:MAG: PorT family protein [Elusimicrobiota bacterium]|jgi:opacity protein-like surface antigen|nr:PorT family protein [Elusimicrobiota bacterium]
MKKLLSALLAVTVFASIVSAVDLKVRAGIDAIQSATFTSKNSGLINSEKTNSSTPEIGFNVGADLLFPIGQKFKVGGGLSYLAPRKLDSDDDEKVSFIPIYATLQFNPIVNNGFYVKANLGLAIWTVDPKMEFSDDSNGIGDTDLSPESGVYVGASVGYEFYSGLFLDLGYEYYNASTKVDMLGLLTIDTSYSYNKLGLNVGYKFKL